MDGPARSVDDARDRVRLGYRGILVLCWLLYVFVAALQVAPASILPLIGEALGVGPAAASWVTSAVFLSMFLAAIPVGIYIDRVDIRRVFLVSGLVVAIATLWTWWAGVTGDYLAILYSRALAGVSIIAIWTACVTLVGNLAPRARQATAITVFATSVPLGFAVGQFGVPLLADGFGWATTFPLLGTAVAVGSVGIWMAAPPTDSSQSTSPTMRDVGHVLVQPRVWGVAVLGFLAISMLFVVNNWMPTFLAERYALTLAASGAFTALFSTVGVLSRASSGWLSDHLLDQRRKPLVVFSFLISTPLVVGLVFADSLGFTVVLLVLAGYLGQLGHVLLFVYVRELVTPELVATALSVLNAIGFLGAFSAPILTGVFIERTGTFVAAFGYAGLLGVVAVAVALLVPESSAPRS
ncbi:MFS transporter [Haloferax sp. YSSS75]|uniref:MFS transporter n=1 Tax=Haloferax sp. YSSS75 TaxID=3388564 RepID=UPI00398CD59B